jgi:hypothetical protein
MTRLQICASGRISQSAGGINWCVRPCFLPTTISASFRQSGNHNGRLAPAFIAGLNSDPTDDNSVIYSVSLTDATLHTAKLCARAHQTMQCCYSSHWHRSQDPNNACCAGLFCTCAKNCAMGHVVFRRPTHWLGAMSSNSFYGCTETLHPTGSLGK